MDSQTGGFNGTTQVTSTHRMFESRTAESFDLSGLDTSRVTDMSCMFRGCERLEHLDLSGFDTSHVTNMTAMFEGCTSLKSLDLSSFDASQVKRTKAMFRGCTSLKRWAISDTWPVGLRNSLPNPTAENGMWWSERDGVWLTVDEIRARGSVADTYTSKHLGFKMQHDEHDGTLTLHLEGRIDTNNAPGVEDEINALMDELSPTRVCLDATDLSYLSSAGLRIVMRLLKRCGDVHVVNAPPAVYDVFAMTGLTEMMSVTRLPRELSLEGLRQIGAGAFGRVFRLDAERVVKVYAPEVNPLDKIERERTSARQAFIHGIPSAIPFETVRVGREHGIVYELVDARTLGEAVTAEPERLEEYATRMAQLLHQLHGTRFDPGQLPDARGIFYGWIDIAERSGLYAPHTIDLLRKFVDGFDEADTFVHGDFHPANIMVMPDDELLLIDMGDASMGSPDIDLAGMFHVLRIAARRPGGAERLTGMSTEALDRLWDTFVRSYFDVESQDDVTAVERRLKTLALPRTMGSTARSKLIDDDTRRRQARELEQEFLTACDALA